MLDHTYRRKWLFRNWDLSAPTAAAVTSSLSSPSGSGNLKSNLKAAAASASSYVLSPSPPTALEASPSRQRGSTGASSSGLASGKSQVLHGRFSFIPVVVALFFAFLKKVVPSQQRPVLARRLRYLTQGCECGTQLRMTSTSPPPLLHHPS